MNRPQVTISLSHRSGAAICAVAPAGVDLGCDLEVIEPRSEAFVADYFTVDEQALVAQVVRGGPVPARDPALEREGERA